MTLARRGGLTFGHSPEQRPPLPQFETPLATFQRDSRSQYSLPLILRFSVGRGEKPPFDEYASIGYDSLAIAIAGQGVLRVRPNPRSSSFSHPRCFRKETYIFPRVLGEAKLPALFYGSLRFRLPN